MRMLSEEPGGDAKYYRREDEQKRGNHFTESIRPTRYAKEKMVRTPAEASSSAQHADPVSFPAIADTARAKPPGKHFVLQRKSRAAVFCRIDRSRSTSQK
jgi:hypothetical protein